MTKKITTRIELDGMHGFFKRVREHARMLDRGEVPAKEKVIMFESLGDMAQVLTEERVRLVQVTRQKEISVTALAGKLKRDARAVSRDIALLENFGLLQTRYVSNPGHGRQRLVEAKAAKFELVATI